MSLVGIDNLLSFLLGVLVTICLQLVFIYKYLLRCPEKRQPVPQQSTQLEPAQLPEILLSEIRGSSWKDQKLPCLVENLLLHFLFREWKDTPVLRRWFMKKLALEFLEIQNTTTGRFLEKISVRDLQLGPNVPVFKSVMVENIASHGKKKTIEEMTFCLDLEYAGGFQLAVDVQTVLGQKAFLSVKVTRLKGLIRWQLTRQPYSHWSFSFKENPDIDFAVESHFQGRVIPRLASIIVTQIRRSLKKKHTLPNYKLRYKPFIPPPSMQVITSESVPKEEHNAEGLLVITVVGCSRLLQANTATPFVYCSVAIDSAAWVEIKRSGGKCWYTQDLEITKGKNERIGITFKEEEGEVPKSSLVIVDSLVAASPAELSGMQKNDIVVSVNGIKVANMKHATKLLKQAFGKFYIRVHRKAEITKSDTPDILNEFDTFLDKDSGEDFGDFVTISRKDMVHGSRMDADEANKDEGKVAERPSNFQDDLENLFESSKNDLCILEASSTPNTPKKEIHDETLKSSLQGSLPDLRIAEEELETGVAALDLCSQATEKPQKPVSSDVPPPSGWKDGEEQRNSRQNSLPSSPARTVSVQKTSLVRGLEDPEWKENLIFQFTGIHRFINVGVWCRDGDQEVSTASKDLDVLVGHVSIPLLPILEECSSTSQGFHIQTFKLLPPDMAINKRTFSHLIGHSGFDERLCYGDITLAFTLKEKPVSLELHHAASASNINKTPPPAPKEAHDVAEQQTPKMRGAGAIKKASEFITARHHKKHLNRSLNESAPESEDEMLLVEAATEQGSEYEKNHDFLSTKFQSATVCNYCKKKIWLKVAFQCRMCGMICHKKCIAKCQVKLGCSGENADAWSLVNNESTTTAPSQPDNAATAETASVAEETSQEKGIFRKKPFTPLSAVTGKSLAPKTTPDATSASPKNRRKGLQNFFSHLASSTQHAVPSPLNRAGSDHNLSLPSDHLSPALSRSLPPSPQHSPAQSRKTSLHDTQANWFNPATLEEQDINKVIEGMVSLPQDEGVLSLAKERGKELYCEFSYDERKDKLNAMISKLQQAIDNEVETRMELTKEDQKAVNVGEKTRLAFQIGKCDERMQALSVLMLHYFSGLQHCLDHEETEKNKPKSTTIAEQEESRNTDGADIVVQKAENIPFVHVQAPEEEAEEALTNETGEVAESVKVCEQFQDEDKAVVDTSSSASAATTDSWAAGDGQTACTTLESSDSLEYTFLDLSGTHEPVDADKSLKKDGSESGKKS